MPLKIKLFLSALYGILTKFILSIPSHHIRFWYLKLILGELGAGSTICRNVEIRNPKNIYIGHNTIINKGTQLDGRGGKLIIGNNVDIARDVYIWTSQHDYNDDNHKLDNKGVIINDYVWIASRANILPGVIIGKGAVVGTCSLVTKNIKEMDVVGGIPAKHITTRTSKLRYTLLYRPLFQ